MVEKIDELRNCPFGLKLQIMRFQMELSQKELAAIIGCRSTSISSWENEKCFPSGFALERIRRFYELPIDFFIEDIGKQKECIRKKRKN